MKGYVGELVALVEGERNGDGAVPSKEHIDVGGDHLPTIHRQPKTGVERVLTAQTGKEKGKSGEAASLNAKAVRPEQVIPIKDEDFEEF
jgi:hypothetical protein